MMSGVEGVEGVCMDGVMGEVERGDEKRWSRLRPDKSVVGGETCFIRTLSLISVQP
jgi:hypothetical protein